MPLTKGLDDSKPEAGGSMTFPHLNIVLKGLDDSIYKRLDNSKPQAWCQQPRTRHCPIICKWHAPPFYHKSLHNDPNSVTSRCEPRGVLRDGVVGLARRTAWHSS
jgi:hypothetical protein